MTSEPGGGAGRRQKRMGPAPFASFEDLSDEVRNHLDSPDEKQTSVVRLPGIREDATPIAPEDSDLPPEYTFAGISIIGRATGTPTMSTPTPQGSVGSTALSLQTPSTPRIDISRASSSSHHDSRDSTPERELFEGHDSSGAKLGLGFREEGALELRSSTEELDFHDPQIKVKERQRAASPLSLRHDDGGGGGFGGFGHQRKDSQSSEIGLLSISGRTSRLSSIGSQGSAHSRISNASHLSVISNQSGVSRSPSPHKMLLETSFCGTKPPVSAQNSQQTGTKVESEVLEQVLLSRKLDPREAILAEGIKIEKHVAKSKQPPEKPARKLDKPIRNTVKSDVTITIDKPPPNVHAKADNSNNVARPPKTIISESGIEYTYIPLKGPLPADLQEENAAKSRPKVRTRTDGKSDGTKGKHHGKSKDKSKERPNKETVKDPLSQDVQTRKPSEPEYIRIKLKPDHMYGDEPLATSSPEPSGYELQKPVSLNLNDGNKKPAQSFTQIVTAEIVVEQPCKVAEVYGKSLSNTPSASPKLSTHGMLKDPNVGSKSPSPALSRKSSFASIFRSKETIVSPESPTTTANKKKNSLTSESRNRSRSRSKSRDRDRSTESIDSKSKQKSVFSIFKPKKSSSTKTKNGLEAQTSPLNSTSSPETIPSIEGIANVEFTFNSDHNLPSKERKRHERHLEGDSVRIPLHSPTYYENKHFLQDLKSSSQESQETVIEKCTEAPAAVEANPTSPRESESNTHPTLVLQQQSSQKSDRSNRQSSTSSENIVFSTKLGSNNEIFTTKLPKEKRVKPYTPEEKDVETTHGETIDVKRKSPVVENNVSTISRESSNFSLSNRTASKLKTVEDAFPSDNGVTAGSNRNSVASAMDDDRNSSGSEKSSEQDYMKKKKGAGAPQHQKSEDDVEPERKGLVMQDSFEDELPYIPTTLPLERSVAVPIVPVKQRGTFEMKTCPIDRPRSTTPINPSCLEDYCEDIVHAINPETISRTIEKLKISLPKDEAVEKPSKQKSPRRVAASNTNWFEFAEKGISSQRRSSLTQEADTPPPLPPKCSAAQPPKEWINFEEIPERRKLPKRIQTIPSRGAIDVTDGQQENVVYNYVNPEDCKCECHEIGPRPPSVSEDELPLLEDETSCIEDGSGGGGGGGGDKAIVKNANLQITPGDRRSTVSDSSIDLSTMSVDPVDPALQVPFMSDLGVTSNRSSIVSQVHFDFK